MPGWIIHPDCLFYARPAHPYIDPVYAPKTPKTESENARAALFISLGTRNDPDRRRTTRFSTDPGVLDDSSGITGAGTRFQVGQAWLPVHHHLVTPSS